MKKFFGDIGSAFLISLTLAAIVAMIVGAFIGAFVLFIHFGFPAILCILFVLLVGTVYINVKECDVKRYGA
jgi:ABC-type branched-subunit amino acid transport system permease subunit